MVVTKEGRYINPSPVCQGKMCGNKSSARLIDKTVTTHKKWKDLCRSHALAMMRAYPEGLEVDAVWNNLDWSYFDDGEH